jgi:adenine-specific DNA methylase
MEPISEGVSFPNVDSAKALGAFYTDIQVADFLVWWAVRSARDTVMDPSFGGGVFLRSACNRLLELGGKPADQVFGVEVDSGVHELIVEKLHDEFGVNQRNLVIKDFFDYEALPVNRVTALVGNPPFIRYQRFVAETRMRALAQAADQGVRLTQLSSSWAPFIVHGISMVKNGGRLAMVLPVELGHASYALPVMKHLFESFGKVTFLTFRKKLFPNLSEDTLLVLAEKKGTRSTRVLHRDLEHAGALSEIQHRKRTAIFGTQTLDADTLMNGQQRLIESLIPKKARELYNELKQLSLTKRLGELVDIGIGYVTGANDFFHLSPREVTTLNIPKGFIKAAVRRGRALTGLRFTRDDWKQAAAVGDAGYVLAISPNAELPSSVRNYLERGRKERVPEAYKCRVRSPWYSVPHIYQPDGFVTYMSGIAPRFVSNDARVVAPNSLHIVRRHAHTTLTCDSIAALWQTSLTRLSVEIEGHALGGGMLKLEPTEAENCILANPGLNASQLNELSSELDLLIRASRQTDAQEIADSVVLQQQLGLTRSDCVLLGSAAQELVNRRYRRTALR